MKRITKSWIAVVAALVLAFGCLGTAVADTATWGSKNKLVVKGEDGIVGTADDIVFDARDLDTIYTEVTDGRKSVAEALNSKGAASINNIPTTDVRFMDLVTGVNNQFTIPANRLGVTVNGTEEIGNASESASSFTASADNLSLGAVAWNADGELITGNGKDNINYINTFIGTHPEIKGIFTYISPSTTPSSWKSPTWTYYIASTYPNIYNKLTSSNFIVETSRCSVYDSNGGTCTYSMSKSYDAITGVLSVSARGTMDDSGGLGSIAVYLCYIP